MSANERSAALPRPDTFPPGLVGDVAEFIYNAAPYPNTTIALAGGIAFVAGIAGRAYNVDGAGLNQYVLTLAPTGAGKEAVAEGIARLMSAAYSKTPRIAEFRGPGELVSAPGLFKWLHKLATPVMLSIIGEFGLMLKAMASPSANANMAGLQRVLLHLWSKSGQGSVFDASAYSDSEKNTGPIKNPSLTIFGEGVPESFYSALDVGMIASGLLPRVLLFETAEPKPYRNRNRMLEPPPALIEGVAALVAQCLNHAATDRAHGVPLDTQAGATFEAFSRFAVDMENGAANDQTRGLWARLDLKALKLAALIAVGRDPFNPRVTHDDAMWATNLIVDQTKALIGKFERGEVGEEAGNEEKQQAEVLRCIVEYIEEPFARFEVYGATEPLHKRHVFTQSYLSRRLYTLPAFKLDRLGPTGALKRAIQNLLDAGDIAEIYKAQALKEFGTTARCFQPVATKFLMDRLRKKVGPGV
ncbi:DUF3987 domain-containing protein [Sphingomonas sp.]|jgi:hypothetical protein|uniref:DUF3987 domain-containing protein n=1 Tax=Sphingomonas sp. TaxID=28214 RepID=UPI002D7F872A|nr:DUF3987 domain-containing protein [Sphingomonas sp.]HEU0044210.1 DUF3987 domain-containing protein [Sphingomonas sp.]